MSKLMPLGLALVFAGSTSQVLAGSDESAMESALSAAPASVTKNATFMDGAGNVLRQGNNGWTCFPETAAMGAMCNSGEWGKMISALMNQENFVPTQMSISYMLAGEGDAPGVSNIDPYATEPTDDNDWTKDGPHLMVILPEKSMLESFSTDPNDPVYVMWKDTPYAHLMIRIEEED